MKILFLTPRFPYPPDRGDRLLAYRTIEIFATRHEVTLLSLGEGAGSPAGMEALRKLGVEVHLVPLSPWRSWLQAGLALFTGSPLQIAYYQSADLSRRVRDLAACNRFDVVIGHLARMGPYALEAQARRRIGLLTDSIALSLGRRAEHGRTLARPLVRLEARRMEAFECMLAERLDASWVVSPVDRDHFPPALRSRIRVVPMGIPREFLALDRGKVVPGRILFLGHLGVPHNVDAATRMARAILPRVRHDRADATLRLVGPGAGTAIRALGGQPGVEVPGYVEDLGGEYASAEAFLAPLRFAAGIQNKLIEAMAAGVPCVASPVVAQGISAAASEHLLVAESDAEFAACALRLFRDPEGAREMGARGRAFVAARFDWNYALEALAEDGRGAVSPEAPAQAPRPEIIRD